MYRMWRQRSAEFLESETHQPEGSTFRWGQPTCRIPGVLQAPQLVSPSQRQGSHCLVQTYMISQDFSNEELPNVTGILLVFYTVVWCVYIYISRPQGYTFILLSTSGFLWDIELLSFVASAKLVNFYRRACAMQAKALQRRLC